MMMIMIIIIIILILNHNNNNKYDKINNNKKNNGNIIEVLPESHVEEGENHIGLQCFLSAQEATTHGILQQQYNSFRITSRSYQYSMKSSEQR